MLRNKRGTGTKPIMPVRIDLETKDRVKVAAEAAGVTMSEYVRRSLVSSLEQTKA